MVASNNHSMWGRVSRALHWGLGTAILGMIAHGWWMNPVYADRFGLLRAPHFTSPDKAAAHQYQDWHITAAYVLLALVAIHVAAALYHHFTRHDGVTARMIGQWSRAPTADMAG
jgi:cytochrome b561